jgi:hypothetical protein
VHSARTRKWKLVVISTDPTVPTAPTASVGVADPAIATRTYRWILTGSNMNKIRQIDAWLADRFFNTSFAYANGNPDAQQNQTPTGYAARPTLRYASYTAFATDLVQGRIDPAIKAVYYDPEHWSETPESEQRDPYTYMRLFAELAHAYGYVAITSPARDLMGVPGGVCVAGSGETYDEAYIRCDIAGAAARYADVSKIQAQVHETEIPAYQSLVETTARQARAANPSVIFLSNLSTSVTTVSADQLFDAAQSVKGIVDGHYLTIQASDASQLNTAVEFFREMRAAGY